jgi:hypothetical protein
MSKFFLTLSQLKTFPFIVINTPLSKICTAVIAEPRLNSASEPLKAYGIRDPPTGTFSRGVSYAELYALKPST